MAIIVHLMINNFKDRIHSRFTKKIINSIKLLILGFAVIMFWRGLWNLVDKYFFPKHFLISQILCISIGIIMIFILDGVFS